VEKESTDDDADHIAEADRDLSNDECEIEDKNSEVTVYKDIKCQKKKNRRFYYWEIVDGLGCSKKNQRTLIIRITLGVMWKGVDR
jgi:hypothetical protein